MRRGLIVLTVVALAAGEATAERKVAFLGFAVEGVSEDVRDQFETLIEEALRKEGSRVVTRQEALDVITRRELPEGCAFGPCVSAVSTPLGVDRILDARIAAVGQSYSFVLTLVEGKMGAPVAQVVGSCAVCTVSEALTKVGDAVAVLEGGHSSEPANDDLVAHKPARSSKAAPILLSGVGAACLGAGAFIVSKTDDDELGWTIAGAGGAFLVTGLSWLLFGD